MGWKIAMTKPGLIAGAWYDITIQSFFVGIGVSACSGGASERRGCVQGSVLTDWISTGKDCQAGEALLASAPGFTQRLLDLGTAHGSEASCLLSL